MADRWTAVLARLGMPTGDGRILAPGGITNRDLPLPLMWQRQTGDGHSGAVVVGVIERINYLPDMVTGEGRFLDVRGSEEAQVLTDAGVTGPSIDLFDNVDFEEARKLVEAGAIGPDILGNMDDLDYVMSDEGMIVVTSGRIAGATLVPIPAFADVSIHMANSTDAVLASSDVEELALVASAAPELPPLEWFVNPQLTEATPITITDEGRVFGHIATWGTCHVGLPGCVTPPESHADYAYFMVGAEKTSDGVTVPVGKLTVGGGHADPNAGFVAAAEHYDDAGTAVASVFAGEDEHGIWVAGRIIPGTDHTKIADLQRSPISGDWRRIGGNLELIAAHAVNVPGFPIPRAKVKFSLGDQLTLIGQFSPSKTLADQAPKKVEEKADIPTPKDVAKMAAAARARWAWAQRNKKGRG
jgi:hypothetical protein